MSDKMDAYDRGFCDGMETFAHWSDGQQLVGTKSTLLKEAIRRYREHWNYQPTCPADMPDNERLRALRTEATLP